MAAKVQTKYPRTCFITDELKERAKWTPDFAALKQKKHHAVFVYGAAKAGGRCHPLLADGTPLGDAYSAQPTFVMKSLGGSHPLLCIATPGQENLQARVYGEVYIVSAEDIMNLDYLEQNGVCMQRTDRFFWLLDQSYKTKTGKGRPALRCWVYVARNDWAYQNQTGIVTRKENGATAMLSKYYEWDLPKQSVLSQTKTQAETMLEQWRNNFGSFASTYPPRHL